MTAPTPGFPPELETAITEALVKHPLVISSFLFPGTYRCAGCKADSRLSIRSSAVDWLRSHQAAVVMEVIAQHATTEWGAIDPGEREPDPDCVSTDRAWVIDECIAGIYEADEEHPRLVCHLVFPWQEVKAHG